MCNNEMNLPLFILVKSPYFIGRDNLSFLSFNFILFLLQVFLQCFNGSDLIFLYSIFLFGFFLLFFNGFLDISLSYWISSFIEKFLMSHVDDPSPYNCV